MRRSRVQAAWNTISRRQIRCILWSPDNPYLYVVKSKIIYKDSIIDTYDTPLGIRTIRFTAKEGFLLNGVYTPIKGACVHQDFAGVGVALPDGIIEYKIRLLKEMGANAYHSSHHPPTPGLLDICDRLGMMVMCENRKLDSSPQGIEDLKSMLLRDRNHPCVIIWSMENEEDLEGTKMGARILKTLVGITHETDPARPVTAAMNHGWNDGGYSEVLDVVGYNYGLREGIPINVNDHKQFPDRVSIGSENVALSGTRGIYGYDGLRGRCSAYGLTFQWSCHPERTWRQVIENPYLSGVFIWTGFDYKGEPFPYCWPTTVDPQGAMDICGFPKDIYYYYKSAWTKEPVVHIFPHWNWVGMEGTEIEVWAFSNCDYAELFLNGKCLGRRKIDTFTHVSWKAAYEPGELTVKGYINDEIRAVKTVVTTGAAAAINLDPHLREISAGKRGVSAIRVSLTDAGGNIVPTADNDITFVLEGPGEIIGLGNGDTGSLEPDKPVKIDLRPTVPIYIDEVFGVVGDYPLVHDESKKFANRRAFNGYCLVIVQAGKESGKIMVKASSPGLKPASAVIDVL